MKIEELDNSKKKSKLLEKARTTTRSAAFFKPKIRIPEPRIQKPKITDIETNWDFKPVPIAPPPLVPGTGPPPPLAPAIVPSLAHKPLKYPKFALAPDTVPVTIPYPGKIPMFNPDISGIKLPEPDISGIKLPEPKMPEPEMPERPDPAGSKWGAKGQGIGTGPAFPPIPPPWKDREPHAYPVPFAKDPVFTKPELELELPDLDPGKLDLPGDKTEFDTVPPSPIKEPKREIKNYTDLSDKAKKVFWKVLKGVEDPTTEMLKVHPNEWKEIIPIQPKTELDKQAIGQFFNPGVVPTWRRDLKKDDLAPRNPEKGVDARDFWEGLGYSSLAQFEKAQKDGGGGKIGYAKGKTTGKQVPVVYPKQAYISKQAFDTGLKIGPKGNIVTRGGEVTGSGRRKKGDETTDTLPKDLSRLTFAPGVLSTPKPGKVAGGTDITPYVQPELSGPVKQAMHNQLIDIARGDHTTKEQRAVIKDINSNYDLLSKKDQQAVTTYMKWVTDKYVDPKDPDMYHFGSGSSAVHLTGEDVAKYLAVGTGVTLGSLALLLPAGTVASAGTAIAGTVSAARLTIPVLIKLMNMIKNSGMIRFATP